MSNTKNCQHTAPCGCGDESLMTPPPCNTGTPECPTPDPCPETFCAGCLVYCGDSIVDLGISQGDRMDVILQRIALWFTNPGCIAPSLSGSITSATITTEGLGYTDGVYVNVTLFGGTGTGATADITIVGGIITAVVLNALGINYTEGDILVPDPALLGPSTPTIIAGITVSIAPCRAILGLHSTTIMSTTIDLAWLSELSAVDYQVEYKEITATSWTLNPQIPAPVLNPTDLIAGLTPDTDYYIRVNNICSAGSCYSVTIQVRTKE
jgi:hypothetical protein